MAENEIMAEPQDIETSPKIPRRLKVHKFVRTYNEDNVYKIEFYKLADETNPFHIQWYRKEGNPGVCGYIQLPLNYETDQTCGYCKDRYKGNEEWLDCKLCDHWFHEVTIIITNIYQVLFHYFVVHFSCLYKKCFTIYSSMEFGCP